METGLYKYFYRKCTLPKLSTSYRVSFFKLKSLQIIALETCEVRPCFLKMLFLYQITLTTYILWEMSLKKSLVGTIFLATSHLILNCQLHHCLGYMSPGKNLYFLNVILFWYSLKHLGSIFNTSMMQKKLVYFDILCKYTYAYPDTSIDSFNNKFYKYLMGMLLHTRQIVKG